MQGAGKGTGRDTNYKSIAPSWQEVLVDRTKVRVVGVRGEESGCGSTLKAEPSGPAGGWHSESRTKGRVKHGPKKESILAGEDGARPGGHAVLWGSPLPGHADSFPAPGIQLHSGGRGELGVSLPCHKAQNEELTFLVFRHWYTGNKPGKC